MAKRRCKNKARRAIVGLSRKVNINGVSLDRNENMESTDSVNSDCSMPDPDSIVQLTETATSDSSVTENTMDDLKLTELSNCNTNTATTEKRKSDQCKTERKVVNDANSADEELIFPCEVDGQTCIDVQCGSNEAYMFLSKLCVGSRGACVKFADSWLTPNEFQLVSGRETAKDWKRSIRHKGRSLKLLISKGLITVQSISPKKCSVENEKPAKEDVPPSEAGRTQTKAKDKTTLTASKSPEPRSQDPPKKRGGRKAKKARGRRTNETADTKKALSVKNADKAADADATTSDTDTNTGRKDNSDVKMRSTPPSPAPIVDTRTDEERRLDEFMKTLRLTKTIVNTPITPESPSTVPQTTDGSISAPSLTNAAVIPPVPSCATDVRHGVFAERNHVEVDPEMPILQKEADVASDLVKAPMDISVSVDALHATVTPPPTPPSERIGIEQKPCSPMSAHAQQLETFKSTLASPSVGLKLTINREKLPLTSQSDALASDVCKPSLDADKSASVTPLIKKSDTASKTFNIQSLLLQDALQSAKKYKEQLQQSRQTSPTKTSTSVIRGPTQSISAVSYKHEHDQDKHGAALTGRALNGSVNIKSEYPVPIKAELPEKRHTTQPTNPPSLEEMRRLSSMSFKDFMATMSSTYGSIPTEQLDASSPSVQELQQKYDMMRMLLSQGHMTGLPTATSPTTSSAASSLLYPSITQQLLLAMTHQMYSMCHIPSMFMSANGVMSEADVKPSLANPTSRAQQAHGSDNHNSRHNLPSHSQSHTIRPDEQFRDADTYSLSTAELARKYCQIDDSVRNKRPSNNRHDIKRQSDNRSGVKRPSDVRSGVKRKSIDVDTNGALDLSMKKPRISREQNTVYSDSRPASVQAIDGPLDFSLKGSNHSSVYNNVQSRQDQSLNGRHNATARNGYTTTSNHSYRSTSTVHHHTQKGVSQAGVSSRCTCGTSLNMDVSKWSVDHVCYFLKGLDGCASYAKTFREQGINGRLLPYLTTTNLTRTLGMNLGPAITLLQAIERAANYKHTPCQECTSRAKTATVPSHMSSAH